MMRIRGMVAAALWMALAACGPAAEGDSVARGGSRVIARAEIQATPATSLLDVVQRVRPFWIQARPVGGTQGFPTVYVGSQPLGAVDRLREIGTENVREVRYLNGPEASARFGAGVPYGVIQVVLDIGG